uniref:Protein fem-1 homolog B n=3 Tax=Hirondellea gigas TaxID=1518452 RepID=A0A6A7G3H6_9CRUS
MAASGGSSVIAAHSLDNINRKVYYAAKHGMAVALCDHLSDFPKGEEAIKEMLTLVVEEDDGQKCTPLIIAARNGHHTVVRALVKYQSDLEQEGTVKFDGYAIEGASALWCAAGAGHLGVVKILVRCGANVNHTTRTNSTPVRAACFDGRLDIVKYLTQHNADIHITNKYNNTCLMIAAYKGHLDVVNYLLDLNANPDEKANCGATALHFAAECGHVEIVQTLLEYGADIVSNEHNMTPLIAAAERAGAKVVEYLITMDNLVSVSDRIDALELLGASYASDKDHYNLEKAHTYMCRAMDLRHADPSNVIEKQLSAPLAPYGYHRECQTIEELVAINNVPTSLHMEALSIRERILGPNNPEVPAAVIFRGAVFADNARFDRCLQLWMHAMRLKLDTNMCVVKDLLRFAQVFSQMVHVGVDLEFGIVLDVLEATVLELQRNHSKIANPGPKDDIDAIKEEIEQNMITSLYLLMIAQRICKSSSSSPTTTTAAAAAAGNAGNNNIIQNNNHNNNNNNNNNDDHLDNVIVNLPQNPVLDVNFQLVDNFNIHAENNNAALGWGDIVGNEGGIALNNFARNHYENSGNKSTRSEGCNAERSGLNPREMRLHRAVYRLVRSNSVTLAGETLLHLAVSPDTPVDDFHTNLICRFPCASTAKLLITCGADVNAQDKRRNTALHLIVAYQKPISDFLTLHNIILGLVEGGAHMDIVNERGATPFQTASTGVAEIILRTQQRLSLQCLASRVIVSSGLAYRGLVPRHLEAFIQVHGPSASAVLAPASGAHHNQL